MIIVDAAIFITIVGLLHYYKSTHPNFLFFCKGAVLFLPPDDEEESAQAQQQQKKQTGVNNSNSNKEGKKTSQDFLSKTEKPGHQIAVIQVEYNQVKTYPFCTQYERIAMTIASLVCFYILRLALNPILPSISLLPFYIIIAIIVYTIKVSVDVFLVSAYRSRTVVLIALGVNLFYFFLAVALGSYEGVYDDSIRFISADYAKHLEIVLGNATINWINQYTVLGLVVFVNFFITLAAIPSVVKFGNWYSKTLKEIYYEQDENQENLQRILKSSKESTKQAQKQLKYHSKNTISLLNYYLIATLLFAFFSHRYAITYIPQLLVEILRLLFLFISTSIILWTAKDAMEFNGSFAYKFVIEYFKEKSKENKLILRKKIIPYIYHVWYHFHQFMLRVMVPLLIVLLIVHWKYLAVDHGVAGNGQGLIDSPVDKGVNYDIECAIDTNELDLIKNLYKCPIKTYKQMEAQQNVLTSTIISGVIKSQSAIQPPSVFQQKILNYGLINKPFMVELSQLLLWYSNITIYGMTVIYVLFLRKTVYEI